MKKRDIVLIKEYNKKIIPLLIIDLKPDKIIGLKVQRYDTFRQAYKRVEKSYSDIEKNELDKKEKLKKTWVIIGKPNGLRYESVVKVNKYIVIEESNIIATISEIDNKLYRVVLEKYKDLIRKELLHKDLHMLKNKIFRCQINNQRYEKYEEMIDEILEELWYPRNIMRICEKNYEGFREVPNEGYIKVYIGGR